MIIFRSTKDNLVINLTSNEPLGILDTDYIEDFNGVDGQLSIYNIDTLNRHAVVMTSVPATTPLIDNDYFTGQKLLALLEDGDYQIEGRVRDIAGNYTILSNFSSPNGNERIINMFFSIQGGEFLIRPRGLYQPKNVSRVYNSEEFSRFYQPKNVSRIYNSEEFSRFYNALNKGRIYE